MADVHIELAMIDRLDWEDVRTLAAVAGNGSVRSAAARLRVHHSTVSRRIERLESAAGQRLFDRRPEGLLLTPAGEALAEAAGHFEASLQSVDRQLLGQDDNLSGAVTLTLSQPLAIGLFIDALPAFEVQYPNIDLRLRLTTDLLDMARREADVAIRMDNNPPDTLVGKRLFAYRETVYCARDYMHQRDLRDQPEAGRWLGWSADDLRHAPWIDATEFNRVPVWGEFATVEAQVVAARRGLGLTLLPCLIGDRADGLIRATTRAPTASRTIWILTHRDLRRTARVRAVMSFAESVLRDGEDHLKGQL
ncbi:MAG: LysR family transcriptional regulator [Pseudomonadota bacterium]